MADQKSTNIDIPQCPDMDQQQYETRSQFSQRRRDSDSTVSLQIEEGAELPQSLEEIAELEPSLPRRLPIILPALIIPFSILGLLIRLGLSSIETFSGQQVFALAWPQFIGCLFMGLFVSTRPWIDQGFVWQEGSSGRRGHWIGPFIYVGLSSGLCGSITTFSSWSLGMFTELINTAKVSRFPLQNILSALSELTVTLALSIVGLQLGTHLGEIFVLRSKRNISSNTIPAPPSNTLVPPQPPTRWTMLDFCVIAFGGVLWIGMILAVIFMPVVDQPTWRHVVFACCFAPPGAILRWFLSRHNAKMNHFPIGTFAANIGGSVMLAAVVCLQHSPNAGGKSALACQVLSGLQDGFCGCLTTISTFALELKSLPRKASYIYGVASVVVAQLCMLLVLGSFVWTRKSTDSDDNVYQHSLCTM